MGADASASAPNAARAPSLRAGGLRGSAREFFSDVGAVRASARRLRVAALVRLMLVVPFVVVPTGWTLVASAERGYAPLTTMWLFRVWLVGVIVLFIANLGMVAVRALRARGVRALSYVTLTAEIVTTQLAMHALGTLTSHGPLYVGVLVAVYRVFFDYRLGLFALVAGSVAYTASAALGFSGLVPASPSLPAFDHLFNQDPVFAGVVVYAVVMALVFTFFAVNYAVNQSAKLHRYITESVLRRYLPPSLVERAARGELSLDAEPERRVVTVMFTDLVGFTTMSEEIGERDVARVLNKYLSECAEVAHGHGATIDKFIGDAVMVLVGAPDELSPEEQARRCVAIARDMQRALEDSPLRMRAGINTGEVIVGHFGSTVRSDFTAVGHAVNMAARLETACEPGRVLVGEETARLLESVIDVEPAGEFQLKGISKPVRAYYVVGA